MIHTACMHTYIDITGLEYVMLVNAIEVIKDLGSPEIFVHLSSVAVFREHSNVKKSKPIFLKQPICSSLSGTNCTCGIARTLIERSYSS